jgi:hypothetical protein
MMMMGADISELPLGEPARFNPSQLEKLCDSMGETRAEAEVAYALARLASLLEQVSRLGRQGPADELRDVLTAVVRDARLIGMATLARVGDNVLACLAADDPIALAATLARLERVGDRSIHAIWDLEDLSG